MPTYDLGNGLHVEVRTREKGHKVPHAHAWKGNRKNSVAISLDGVKIAGGIRHDRAEEKRAAEWIVKHAEELKKYWRV